MVMSSRAKTLGHKFEACNNFVSFFKFFLHLFSFLFPTSPRAFPLFLSAFLTTVSIVGDNPVCSIVGDNPVCSIVGTTLCAVLWGTTLCAVLWGTTLCAVLWGTTLCAVLWGTTLCAVLCIAAVLEHVLSKNGVPCFIFESAKVVALFCTCSCYRIYTLEEATSGTPSSTCLIT